MSAESVARKLIGHVLTTTLEEIKVEKFKERVVDAIRAIVRRGFASTPEQIARIDQEVKEKLGKVAEMTDSSDELQGIWDRVMKALEGQVLNNRTYSRL